MVGFMLKRAVWAAVLLVIISFFTYIMFFVIAAQVHIGRQAGAGTTSVAAQFEFTGQPVPEAYSRFLWGVVRHGELGHSFVDRRPVTEKLGTALPVTATLVIGGSLFWMLLAFPIGILSAMRPRSLLDRTSMICVLIGVSAHPVWIGLVLSWALGFKLHLFPIAGYCNFFHPVNNCGGAVDWAYHMLLPWLTFAFLFAALYARMIRATVIETLNEDYVRTARAKGAGRIRVLRSHVLRNALLPIVTMLGMDMSLAFGGVLFIETVFNLPGIGKIMVEALGRRDLPVVMGVVLLVALAVVVANAIVDFIYRWIDPKVRLSGEGRRMSWRPRLSMAAQPGLKVSRSPTT